MPGRRTSVRIRRCAAEFFVDLPRPTGPAAVRGGDRTLEGFHDLLQRARTGDRRAMDEVLERLRPELEPIARRYADPLRPAESTTDLLQESCIRAWQGLGRFEGGENDEQTFAMFRAWMGQIVKRLGLNARRDGAAKGRSPAGRILPLGAPAPGTGGADGERIDLAGAEATPSAHARADELSERIAAAVERIEDGTDRTIVRLRSIEGLPLTEIAEKLGLPYNTVRERHRVCVRRIRDALKDWL